MPRSTTTPEPGTAATASDHLARRLTDLAQDALHAGYPFTAEHLLHLAKFVVNDEGLVAAELTRGDVDPETAGAGPAPIVMQAREIAR
jgi:hypothetical protein